MRKLWIHFISIIWVLAYAQLYGSPVSFEITEDDPFIICSMTENTMSSIGEWANSIKMIRVNPSTGRNKNLDLRITLNEGNTNENNLKKMYCFFDVFSCEDYEFVKLSVSPSRMEFTILYFLFKDKNRRSASVGHWNWPLQSNLNRYKQFYSYAQQSKDDRLTAELMLSIPVNSRQVTWDKQKKVEIGFDYWKTQCNGAGRYVLMYSKWYLGGMIFHWSWQKLFNPNFKDENYKDEIALEPFANIYPDDEMWIYAKTKGFQMVMPSEWEFRYKH